MKNQNIFGFIKVLIKGFKSGGNSDKKTQTEIWLSKICKIPTIVKNLQ